MGMTMAEKILARHSGRKVVSAGEYVTAEVDQVCIYDSIVELNEDMEHAGLEGGLTRIWDKDRIVVLIDHSCPAMDKNVNSAIKHVKEREIVKRLGLPHFFDVKAGICHQVMLDKGFVAPGELVLVADSHTTIYGGVNCGGTGVGEQELAWVLAKGSLWFMVPPAVKMNVSGRLGVGVMGKDVFLKVSGDYGVEVGSYKSMEWSGDAISAMSLDGRICIANQSVELGAKFSLFECDQKVLDFVTPRARRPFTPVAPDADAEYESVIEIDGGKIVPLVAQPHGFEVVKPADQYENVLINEAIVGGCANGRLEDIAMAAKILKGRKVHHDVRCIIGPASWEIYMAAMNAGYLQTLIEAECLVVHPHCGPCTGVMGTLAPGEVCITSTSRNFKGRMGSPEAFIYLASPATVAASAVTGHITDPRCFL
jgi:3-isopropylmalate/(R)-2-methylmalate dehydratase large subunit